MPKTLASSDPRFVKPPRRRVGAQGLIRDERGSVLLVARANRTGPARWVMPGGCVPEGHDAKSWCAERVRQETGLAVEVGPFLVTHRMPPTEVAAEGYNLVFDCGRVESDSSITLSEELSEHLFVSLPDLDTTVAPYTGRRIRAALRTITAPGFPAYLEG